MQIKDGKLSRITLSSISVIEINQLFSYFGRNARNKAKLIDTSKHLVLEAAHPSPLSAYNGFFGCGHFKTANDFLCMNSEETIDWQIRNL